MKYIRYSVAVLISLILSAVAVTPTSEILSCVTSAVYSSNDSVCCIEDKDSEYAIYNINSEGKYTSVIKKNKIEKNGYHNFYTQLIVEGENVYVSGYTEKYSDNTLNGSDRCYKIYRCDFKARELIEVWSFSPQTAFFDTFIRDGDLYYIEYERDEQTNTGNFKIYKVSDDKSDLVSQYIINTAYICEEIFYDNNKNIVFRTNSGNIYKIINKYDKTGHIVIKRLYPSENIKYNEAATLRFSDNGKDKIYAVDVQSDSIICIDTTEDTMECNNNIGNLLGKSGKELSDIRWISYTDDDNFISSIENGDDHFQICCCENNNIKIIEMIVEDTSLLKKISGFVVLFIAFTAAEILIAFIIYVIRKKYISIILRILFFIISFISISYTVFSYKIQEYIESRFEQYEYQNMSYIINNRIKYLDMAGFDTEELFSFDWDRYAEGNSEDIERYKKYVKNITETEKPEKDTDGNSKYLMSFYLKDSENELKMFINSGMSMNVKIDYTLHHGTAKKIEKCIDDGKEYRYKKYDYDRLRYYCIVFPVYKGEKKIGAAEISICKNSVLIKTDQIITVINNIVYSVVILLSSVITIMILLCVYPLKALKKCAEKSVTVETALKAEVFGKNDVSMLSVEYNNTVSELNSMIRRINDVNRCYKYYVPSGAVKLLEKMSASDIKPETESVHLLNVLYICFEEDIKNADDNSFKDILNTLLMQSVSQINKSDGFINHCSKEYIDIYFDNNATQALRTALFINHMAEKNNLKLFCMVHTSTMKIKIIGNKENYGFCFLYDGINEIKKIILSADDYNSRIIISGSTQGSISNFKEIFSSRLLGVFRVGDDFEKIYDIFDSDTGYEKNKKRITLSSFENGVKALTDNNYYDARKEFLDVLRIYPEDKAAKKYFYICDNKIQAKQN